MGDPGADIERAADLQAACCDPRIAGMLRARDGYGAARVPDRLDWTAISHAAAKPLRGSGDTA